jgi:protein-ribulosamine 3-kinase
MEAKIKAALGLNHLTSVRGRGGGGCISQGDAYESDKGMLFVKRNSKQDVRIQLF